MTVQPIEHDSDGFMNGFWEAISAVHSKIASISRRIFSIVSEKQPPVEEKPLKTRVFFKRKREPNKEELVRTNEFLPTNGRLLAAMATGVAIGALGLLTRGDENSWRI